MEENRVGFMSSVEEPIDKVRQAQDSLNQELEEHLAKTGLIKQAFDKAGILPRWNSYNAVRQFKSVRRAIRRGRVDLFTGMVVPKRPFNNAKDTPGRKFNRLRKQIHGELKQRAV